MADQNRVLLLGRLGADPEIRTTQGGEKIANFRIATSERWKDKNSGEKKERTEWHTIVVFGPQAETVEQYLRKGARCQVEGALRTRKWQDQSGNDRYSTEVVVSGFGYSVNVIDWPDSGGGAAQGREDAYGELPGTSGGSGASGRRGGGDDGQRGDYGGGRAETSGGAPYDDEIPF